MAEELIRMENVSKFYGRVRALEDVNLVVLEREIVGLLGDNGAGKSTLIKVLSGAVPRRGRPINAAIVLVRSESGSSRPPAMPLALADPPISCSSHWLPRSSWSCHRQPPDPPKPMVTSPA